MKNFSNGLDAGRVLSCVVAAVLVVAAALAVSTVAANGIVYLIEGDAVAREPRVFVDVQATQGYVGSEGKTFLVPPSGFLNMAQPSLSGVLPTQGASAIPGKAR